MNRNFEIEVEPVLQFDSDIILCEFVRKKIGNIQSLNRFCLRWEEMNVDRMGRKIYAGLTAQVENQAYGMW